MSYDRNVFIGYFAAFTKSKAKLPDGEEKVRQCPTDKAHSRFGKFCSTCGAEIINVMVPKTRPYGAPHHMIGETSQEELDYMTGGKVSVEDIKKLNTSHAVFPLYSDDNPAIIMAPGYIVKSDIAREDGFIQEVDMSIAPPSPEWIALVERVFDATNVTIKFGVVMEVR